MSKNDMAETVACPASPQSTPYPMLRNLARRSIDPSQSQLLSWVQIAAQKLINRQEACIACFVSTKT